MTVKKFIFVVLGCICLTLGTVGVILPIFPTVPFYLATAFCFANSSERLHSSHVYHSFVFFISLVCNLADKSALSNASHKRYVCWIADYRGKCYYTGNYGIWQDCAKTVPGINSGAVDHDYGYVDYPSIIKAAGKNNYPKSSTTAPSSPTKPTTNPTPAQPTAKKKTVEELAKEVIAGKWSA